MLDAEMAPPRYRTILTVNLRELRDRDFIYRCIVMNVNRECVVSDDKFLRDFTSILRRLF